jgi:hypothetical protein
MNARVAFLLHLQRRAFEVSPWHSLIGAIEGVQDEMFFRIPPAHNGFPWMDGSIADIIYHVAGDKYVQLSQAFGDGSVTWESLSISKGDRVSLVRDLHAANVLEVDALSKITDDDLSRRVKTWGGKLLTTEDFFLMLIEHDLYHAGQIRTLRNILEVG